MIFLIFSQLLESVFCLKLKKKSKNQAKFFFDWKVFFIDRKVFFIINFF